MREPILPEGWFIPTIKPFSEVPSSLSSVFPIDSSLSILRRLIESRFLESLTHLPFPSFGLNLGDETGVIGPCIPPALMVIIEVLRASSSAFPNCFSSFSAQSFKNFEIFLRVEISSPKASSMPSMRYSAWEARFAAEISQQILIHKPTSENEKRMYGKSFERDEKEFNTGSRSSLLSYWQQLTMDYLQFFFDNVIPDLK